MDRPPTSRILEVLLGCLLGGTFWGLTPAPGETAVSSPQELSLLYTGAVAGQVEPCGCSPETDFGGIVRWGGWIETHRDPKVPWLLVDAGGLLGDEDTPQARLRVQILLQALEAMDYDVVAFQPQDSPFPREVLVSWIKAFRVPHLVASGEGPRSLTLKRGRIWIQVSLDPDTPRLPGHLHLLLGVWNLAHLPPEVRNWDIVILASGERLLQPEQVGKTLVVAGYPQGQRLGLLRLVLDPKGRLLQWEHQWIPLGPKTPTSPRMETLMARYNQEVARLFEAQLQQQSSGNGDFVGVEGCILCHQPYVDQWKTTDHARAWEDLKRVGKDRDPECVRCHVVGFGRPGGYRGVGAGPDLRGVQCEACHGPARIHLEDFSPLQSISEATCRQCHIPSHSPSFRYGPYRERILHRVLPPSLEGKGPRTPGAPPGESG